MYHIAVKDEFPQLMTSLELLQGLLQRDTKKTKCSKNHLSAKQDFGVYISRQKLNLPKRRCIHGLWPKPFEVHQGKLKAIAMQSLWQTQVVLNVGFYDLANRWDDLAIIFWKIKALEFNHIYQNVLVIIRMFDWP